MDADRRAELERFLTTSLAECLEYGHWLFTDPFAQLVWHSDQRIVPERMYVLCDGWAQLMADVVLDEPSGGLVGLQYFGDEDWVTPLATALEQRGAELPVIGVTHLGRTVVGPALADLPSGASVTVFNPITTLGTDLHYFRRMVDHAGVRVHRLLSIVHRGPSLPRSIDGLPYETALHFPLALQAPSRCFECLLDRPLHPLIA
jgi:hypothetical protein